MKKVLKVLKRSVAALVALSLIVVSPGIGCYEAAAQVRVGTMGSSGPKPVRMGHLPLSLGKGRFSISTKGTGLKSSIPGFSGAPQVKLPAKTAAIVVNTQLPSVIIPGVQTSPIHEPKAKAEAEGKKATLNVGALSQQLGPEFEIVKNSKGDNSDLQVDTID